MSTTSTTTTTTMSTSHPTISYAAATPISSFAMSTSTIKLLHVNPTITPFDGEDITSYSPVQFLQMCDDVSVTLTFKQVEIKLALLNPTSKLKIPL